MSIFAWGLRNTVGLAFSPTDQTLWGTDVSRDGLGRHLPPDEINQIVADGNYGWPYCFGDQIVDPQLGSKAICQKTQASRVDLPVGSEPLGIVFGHQLHAPTNYRNSLYVTLHGRPARENSMAGKLVRIPYGGNRLSDHGQEFIRGWGTGEQAWGAPAAIVAGTDGSLYVSDDKAQVIYRISWKPKVAGK
jgi:glucose/arabinose dehydrogenase